MRHLFVEGRSFGTLRKPYFLAHVHPVEERARMYKWEVKVVAIVRDVHVGPV